MPPLSAVIITFNEEQNIGRCIKPAQAVTDEIIVLDPFPVQLYHQFTMFRWKERVYCSKADCPFNVFKTFPVFSNAKGVSREVKRIVALSEKKDPVHILSIY